MLSILSPAKSIDLDNKISTSKYTTCEFLDSSEALVKDMKQLSPNELADTFGVSEKLAELNFERYQDWSRPEEPNAVTRPAIAAFTGDVYQGFDANTLDSKSLQRAQKTVRILSGLYGLLRPLDLIMPYRLEMGTKVSVAGSSNLYDFWRPKLASTLDQAIAKSPGEKVLVNLASNEYSKAIKTDELTHKTISPKFLDSKGGSDYKVISFFAKRARGEMARWITVEQPEKIVDLARFDSMGYRFSKQHSTPTEPAFTRIND